MQESQIYDDAILLLKDNIGDIHTVTEWAAEMGYSRPHFSVLVRNKCGRTPYQIIKNEKYRRIRQLVRANPRCKGFWVARKVGFRDVKALYKFLKLHFDITLTRLRSKALAGKLNWL